MHFEQSIDVEARQQRVWEVLSDLEAWPQRIETVDVVELLTPTPVGEGSRVRLKQPKLPEGTWVVTVWDAPSYFEYRQKSGGRYQCRGPSSRGAGGRPLPPNTDAGYARPAGPSRRSVLQGPDQPLHDRGGSGHEARSRVRLRPEGTVKRPPCGRPRIASARSRPSPIRLVGSCLLRSSNQHLST